MSSHVYFPSLPALGRMAATAHYAPIYREVLADVETPVSAFVKLVGDREGFLLESVEHADRWGRFSFIGRDPALTMVVRGRHVELDGVAPPGIRPTRVRSPPSRPSSVPTALRPSRSCRPSTAAWSATSAMVARGRGTDSA